MAEIMRFCHRCTCVLEHDVSFELAPHSQREYFQRILRLMVRYRAICDVEHYRINWLMLQMWKKTE